MSKNSVSRGSTNGAVSSEIKFAGNDKEKMYEPKHRRKLVRVLTVIAYLFSVSLAAIMLSLFYIFIYSPGKPAGENDDKFSQLLARTRYHRVSKALADGSSQKITFPSCKDINNARTHLKIGRFSKSLDLMNDTHLNLEREEPRALPFKGFSDLFSIQSERLPEDDLVYFNYSDKSEKENKIIFKKL